jgi:hypothetical protein
VFSLSFWGLNAASATSSPLIIAVAMIAGMIAVGLIVEVFFQRIIATAYGIRTDYYEVRTHYDNRTQTSPPRWAEKALIILLPRKHAKSIPGDIEEVYRDTIFPKVGPGLARLWYVKEVVLTLVPFIPARVYGWLTLTAVLDQVRRWIGH